MRRQKFNTGWRVQPGVTGPFDQLHGSLPQGEEALLPHDAMILEPRDPACESGAQTGFYPTRSYTYQKDFPVPADWAGDRVLLEFQGVMQKAMVYLNGEFLGGHSYGYTGFTVDLTPSLRPGGVNRLKVLAIGQERASRWYTGMGIYRDVYLWRGRDIYLPPHGVKAVTECADRESATVRLEMALENRLPTPKTVRVRFRLLDPEGAPAGEDWAWAVLAPEGSSLLTQRLVLDAPRLWSPDHPDLYTWQAELWEGESLLDREEGSCGLRTLQVDARHGLRLNGETVKLRGACIHHDHGVIGAASFYDGEEFKMRGLKAAGFNAVRSAHHPAGEALLEACDRVGILVMDELSDMWNEPKNPHDFGLDFARDWESAARAMVEKDQNHPCVVLYSTGNEIPEISRAQGAWTHSRIAARLRELDPTRFTTCGINGFLAVSDLLPEGEEQENPQGESAGSEALNQVMGGQDSMDGFSVSPLLTERLEPTVSSVDVVGYNYLTARHELEHRRHPQRVVVGSETFPPEIGALWPIVEKNPHVIGDFTWTGWDYLGEAGIGIFHYGEAKGQGWYPDRLAYCGDISLNGFRRPASYLREIAYGLRKAPYIAVERPERYGEGFDKNNWKYIDALPCWTYPGFEGKPVKVYVLAPAGEVELFLNGRSLGRKTVGEAGPLTAVFQLEYQPGELRAAACRDGALAEETVLSTAGPACALQVEASREAIQAGEGLCFLTVDLADREGRVNRREEKPVTVKVEGAGTLLGFGSGAPSAEGSYQDRVWPTFDGRVMAVVRAGQEPGEIRVTFSAPGCADEVRTIRVTAP